MIVCAGTAGAESRSGVTRLIPVENGNTSEIGGSEATENRDLRFGWAVVVERSGSKSDWKCLVDPIGSAAFGAFGRPLSGFDDTNVTR